MTAREPVVSLHGVSFAYGAAEVLSDIDLEVRPGEFVALVGPNGSGKSTLLRLLLGLLRPQAGEIELFGGPPDALRSRHRLGYVPQRPGLANDLTASVADVVAAGLLSRGRWWARRPGRQHQAIDRALTAVSLADRRHERIRDLSGGQQQRAFIARALAADPELLVLDEPVAGVDAESQRQFRESLLHLVRERGGTVLLVSHELGAVADVLDRVVVLKRTVRFDGPPAELSGTGVHLGVHDSDLPFWLEQVE
ncbi:MAG: metal ABC transporter ATP-binding protein [Acidobacteria bacterium]|nr:metal ABC transporter ATP-binding protein [Acidobacteriota bacterium]